MTQKLKSFYFKYITIQNMLIISLVFCLTSLSLFNLSLIFYNPPKPVLAKTNNYAGVEFWQNFLALHPTYFNGWVELSSLQIQNGDLEAARESYSHAFRINPNSEELIILKLKLGV